MGHALACALKIALSLPWVPSPAGIYTLARCIDRTDGAPLTDEGSMPNQAVRGVAEWGIRPIQSPTSDGRFSDADPATINREPTLLELETDATTIAIGAYAITSFGSARISDIRAALSGGYPVTVAVDASDGGPLQDYSGGVLSSLGNELDHYACAVGIDDFDVVTVRNSWGASWGERGNFRIAGAAIDQLGDLYALSVRIAP